jgi:hypothetical protein
MMLPANRQSDKFALRNSLSKSAANILLTLVYLVAGHFALRYPQVRWLPRDAGRQPLLLPLLFYAAVVVLGLTYSENLSDGLSIVNRMAGMTLVCVVTEVLVDNEKNDRSRQAITKYYSWHSSPK